MEYIYFDYSHLDNVLEIEEESNTFPWTVLNFRDCLEKGYYALVLQRDKTFIGFAIMAISSEEYQLLNIGIKKEERG